MSSSSGEDSETWSDTPMTTPCPSPPMNTYLRNYRRRSSCSSIASIDFGALEFSFRIPNTVYFRTSQLIFQYSEHLNQPGNEPKTLQALVAKFLAFVADGGLKRTRNPADIELLTIVLVAFEQKFLVEDNIHCLANSEDGSSQDEDVIGCYYKACAHLDRKPDSKKPALLRAAEDGTASIYTVFGGQGNTTSYFEDIRSLHATYTPLIAEFLISSAEQLVYLSRDKRCRKNFSGDLDILKWLRVPSTTPKPEVLISAPYSFPLIGLLQLLNYIVTCKVMGETPCTFRRHLSGTTGHSQGIVAAVVTAAADSWESFHSIARSAITLLFWIGVRSQQAYPQTVLSPATIKDSVDHGEGVPTPMLSVRDLPQSQLMKYIDKTNTYFPTTERVEIALINNAQNFVVTGPPLSLHGLNVRLRQIKAAPDADQARIPFSKRKPTFSHSFLPITAPFHSRYLSSATAAILNDVKDLEILGRSLRISVYHPASGEDLSRYDSNLVPEMVRMITEEVIDWPAATKFRNATHIIDFGPGGASGIGMLTNRNKEGRGVRVILADRLDGVSTAVGYRPELFTQKSDGIRYGSNWAKDFGPRLIRTPSGTVVETKLSRVLGLPPLIIGGMTPTTVPWDVVAAAMNAGYHIELAAGGYHSAEALENAILQLETAIPVGRGITVNVIYASPQAIAWQIPLLARLRSEGVPIDGLTVGAGVPSPEIAQSYIETIGLKHISFKPGSTAAIEAVISIAKANPGFPIILQWTGGRAGGHHSFEDFHQPILGTYEKIRKCPNLILVAGSGFGGAHDTYPYLNGEWSLQYGYPRMPFDGCLFGSRIMVSKEAHTSPDAKLAIVNTPGLPNSEWEKTYKGPEGAGGVVTVISEMGEPIHMLATRGAKFWSEMDQKVFKLPPTQRLEVLKKEQKSIVKRLNEDFQKVWFGRDSEGHPVELDDMTYMEVLNRLVQLLYVKRRGNWEWIDKSHEKLTYDFIRRIQERFQTRRDRSNIAKVAIQDPHTAADLCSKAYPSIRDQLMSPQDVSYFLQLCQRRGQKPVPFIPVLDDNFQVYFKKDSLWQSEDLEAVVDQDVGRTCILHGPVAAKHSVRVDETIKDIMDGINQGHILNLIADSYGGTICSIPGISFPWTRLGNKASTMDALANIDTWMVSETEEKHIYRVPLSEESPLPATDSWLHLLAGSRRNWREVLFLSEVVMRGHRYQRNPFKDIFVPVPGQIVEISHPDDDTYGSVALKQRCSERGVYVTVASVEFWNATNEILLCLWSRATPTSKSIALPLRFTYHPEASNAPIRELLDNRNERIRKFFWKTWFGDDQSYDSSACVSTIFAGDEVTITPESVRTFANAVGYPESSISRGDEDITIPIDYAIVVAWKAITKPLFCETLDGNLLNLVHLSNEFKMVPGADPLKVGETVLSMSRITAVVNQDSGRMVEVQGTVLRQNAPVIEVVSRFLFRGVFKDFSGTFETKQEAPFEVRLDGPTYVAILTSKPWVSLDLEDPETELLNKDLEFRLSSTSYFKDKKEFEIVKSTGDIMMRLQSKNAVKIGTVKYSAGVSRSNPVLDYLHRHGTPIAQTIPLKNPIPIETGGTGYLIAPSSNEIYADASGDTNPIHVSPVFAQYVNLPGTITHGMWTSAAVRKLLEESDDHAGRVRSWSVKFVGMVLPNDTIQATFHHVAMAKGRKVIRVEARKVDTNELVLTGEAEVEQPLTAYIFTGQGSQRKGMGMDLRESSAAARTVWDQADSYFTETYGFALTHIIQNDPRELTIHFGGPKGKRIRQNYISLTQTTLLPDGTPLTTRLLPTITPSSPSYTFRSPQGLLSATQFTQPALTLMELALFQDMSSKGLIQENSLFAGHSLGEYAALAALGGHLFPVEIFAAVTFYRGLAMQMAVPRDAAGRSDYTMCAVNPSKISQFSASQLQDLVSQIAEATGELLEVVNFNIENLQYICAGSLTSLSLLSSITSHLLAHPLESPPSLATFTPLLKHYLAHPQPYTRNAALTPLPQIDVPFHSSALRGSIPAYRAFLETMISRETDLEPLEGRWVANITGRRFCVAEGMGVVV